MVVAALAVDTVIQFLAVTVELAMEEEMVAHTLAAQGDRFSIPRYAVTITKCRPPFQQQPQPFLIIAIFSP